MRLGILGLALVVLAVPAVLEAPQTGQVPATGHLVERTRPAAFPDWPSGSDHRVI
jgi:hypothetical protein